ncbi:MAG: Uncharacterised protein [Formosa sp. Hel1_33_131]|nr:MAG: Uncharacterised protein [Formosa sp. Hel1_33_131]
MKEQEIDKLIQSNEGDKLSFYLSNLLSKSKEIEKENNKLGIMMLILILLFYLIDYTSANSLNIGPITIKDLAEIRIFIPLVFAFLILRYKVINSHKAELIKIIKKISNQHFSYDNKNVDIAFIDDFTRTLLPISIYEEFNKFNYKKTSGCIGTIIILPLSIALMLIPYIFEYFWLKELIIDFLGMNFYGKTSTIITIWVLILSIYYFIQTMRLSIIENERN